ncbi:hypothetical protein RSOLAG22IIIB_07885 [Rhizoctonia solani]|uniref:Uncharacterized protein n=1 Tax=Rhizoctonia solani TaxID=456999 RepID=A0A0K6FQ47_9AGAM|nr:hypothetical protein RSOLAG22IIIB_07885 [Rhizoctonia solani]
MSSIEEFDALAATKLEEHYAAAGEPEEIDDAFASGYFESLAEASDGKVVPLPGKAIADFLKGSQAFVNVKFEGPDLKFGSLQSGGRGAVFGKVVPGQTGTFLVKQIKKALLIRITNDGGKPWEGALFIGFSWSPIGSQSGTGTWEKL